MKRIAIIPARQGSKRIPYKNIKLFAGKPMIAYAITKAKQTNLFDHIVVSTDDSEIARIATEYGAEVPFTRPAELADDHTPTVPVIAHAIDTCQGLGWQIDQVCCIYPTVPFLLESDLVSALRILLKNNLKYVFPVTSFPSAIQRAMRQLPNALMEPIWSQYSNIRTQDLEPSFYDAGQFYWGLTQTWLDNKIIHKHGAGLIIPSWRVVDIDNIEDWQRAELLFAVIRGKNRSV